MAAKRFSQIPIRVIAETGWSLVRERFVSAQTWRSTDAERWLFGYFKGMKRSANAELMALLRPISGQVSHLRNA